MSSPVFFLLTCLLLQGSVPITHLWGMRRNWISSLLLQWLPSLSVSCSQLWGLPIPALRVSMVSLPSRSPPCSFFSCSSSCISFLALSSSSLISTLPSNSVSFWWPNHANLTQPTARTRAGPWEFALVCGVVCLSPVRFNSALSHAPHCPSKFKALQGQKLCLIFALMLPLLLNALHTVGAPDAPHTAQCSAHSGHPRVVTDRWVSWKLSRPHEPMSHGVASSHPTFLLTSKVRAESQKPPKMSWWSYNDTLFVYKSL